MCTMLCVFVYSGALHNAEQPYADILNDHTK